MRLICFYSHGACYSGGLDNLRAGVRGQLEVINQLLKQLSPNSPQYAKEDQMVMALAGKTLVLAKDTDDLVIGMATVSDVSTLTGKRAYVDDVVVLDSHRGQGVAREIMEAITRHYEELGYDSLNLTCQPRREAANKLYPAVGYEKRDTNVYRLKLSKQENAA